jgi:hypothetical protein
MDSAQLSWIANFIWGIADDVLRDLYVRGKYRDVILPMVVLRRLDAVLEPTKKAVLDMKASLDKAKIANQDAALRQAAGHATLGVGLAIDLPRGLDSASASVAYADAQPVLLSGFWLEIASGVVLAAAGLMMALSPSGAEARSRRRATPSDRGTTDRRDDRRRNRDRAAAGGTA